MNDTPRLVVRSIAVDLDVPLVHVMPPRAGDELFSWVRGGQGVVGWGVAARVDTPGPQRFARARDWWQEVVERAHVTDEVQLPGTGLAAFGSMAFSASSSTGGTLVVPRVVVGRAGERAWRTTVHLEGEPAPTPDGPASAPLRPHGIRFADGDQPATAYVQSVEAGVDAIRAGQVDKIVLARDLVATSDSPLDVRHLLQRLADTYPTTWVFAVDGLVGATPEMLVRLSRGLVTSRVLAGTIRRTGDDDRDVALAGSLARSSKDLEEHEYAVRSVADALAPFCTSMQVPEAPFVLHLPNVMHLASDVAGVLAEPATSLSLAEALHPSAAVCGTPTEVAGDVIARLEGMDRGRYAGPIGWMTADGDGEWGIALRCAQVETPDRLRLYAGCGIVAGSVPAAELAESDAKFLPVRDALTS